MANIEIRNRENFKEAKRIAKLLPTKSRKSFIRSLHSINRLKRSYKADTVVLQSDFVPHSFIWSLNKEGHTRLLGGMILHGFGEGFLTDFTEHKCPIWSIHT